MIKILTVDEIRQAETAADAAGYSYATMMQDAGRAVADRVLALVATRVQPKITFLVGSGNNGGDGLVAARLIQQDRPESQVRLYLLTRRDETDPVFNAAQSDGLFIAYAEDDHDNRVLRNMVASADVILDALFGIGARLPLKDAALKALRGARQALNERAEARRNRTSTIDPTLPAQVERPPKQIVVAVDCPSGLDCNTGELDKNTLIADETITFIAAKPGLFALPGMTAVGRLVIAPLNMPEGITTLDKATHTLLDHENIQTLLPARPVDGHKGTFGKVLAIGGSVNYTGAIGLSAQSAYRSGAGLVTVGAPAPVIAALASQMHEVTWLLLAHDMGALTVNAAATIREALDGCKALLIGPGIGREPTTRELLQALLTPRAAALKRSIGFGQAESPIPTENTENNLPPLVLDADALNVLSELDEWWTLLPAGTIITPHPGEMARLAKVETREVQAKRYDLALEKAAAWNAVIVLKGAHTIIAAPDGKTATSPFKTDALAKAGTGDVLAGVIAGFLAQGLTPFAAAQVGIYVHALAGVQAAAQLGTGRAVLAGEVLNALASALQIIERVQYAE